MLAIWGFPTRRATRKIFGISFILSAKQIEIFELEKKKEKKKEKVLMHDRIIETFLREKEAVLENVEATCLFDLYQIARHHLVVI